MRWHDGRAPCPVSGPEAPRCGVEPPTVTAVADARAAQKRLLGACPGFPAVSGGVCTTRIGAWSVERFISTVRTESLRENAAVLATVEEERVLPVLLESWHDPLQN